MARDHSMLTAEELRLRTQKRRRIVLALLLVLVLSVGAFFAARPTRNAIKGWQARRHASKAFTLIAAENWKEARDEAVAAYQLRPAEPQALRAVARFLSRTRQPQALEFWDQLAQREPLTLEDLRDQATVAMTSGETERANAAVEALLANNGKEATPRDWLLVAQFRLQQGAPEKALDSLGKFFAQPASSPREKLQATLLQLQAARTGNAELDSRNQSEAWERMSQLAQGNDAVALDSLVLLAQRQLAAVARKTESGKLKTETSAADRSDTPPPSPSSAPVSAFQLSDVSFLPDELVRRLEAHPLAQAPQKLLALDLRLHANPSERESLTDRAIAEWKDSDADSLTALAKWLNGKGEYQRLLDEIPQEKALGSRELFLQRMDALGALGRWDEIRQLLESERFPLDQVMQRMYLARANAQLGNEAAAKNNWQRALEAAAGDVSKLITLAEYAEKNGAIDIAQSAYTQSTTAAPKQRAAWQGRLRTTYSSRDTKSIHAILAEMLKLWPHDTAVQNDEAYTRLLLLSSSDPSTNDSQLPTSPEQLVAIEKLAQELVQKEPASLPHRTLLALALLKQGRPVAALDVYKGIQVDARALSPSSLAVHAAVLAANDHREDARTEIQHVPAEKLLPEEQAATADLRE